MRALRGHPDGVLAVGRVVSADRAARLDRRRDQPLVDEALRDDDVGLAEGAAGRIRVAAFPLHADVPRSVLVELGSAGLDRLLGIDHDREHLPVDVDQRHRVLGRVAILGHDRGDTGARVVTWSISSARGVFALFVTPPACQAQGSGLRCSKSLPV